MLKRLTSGYQRTTARQRKQWQRSQPRFIVRHDYERLPGGGNSYIRRTLPKANQPFRVRGEIYHVNENGSLVHGYPRG